MNSSYKIIEGLPKQVETDVQSFLMMGWKLNGELFHRNHEGITIAVQGIKRISADDKQPTE